MTELSKSDIRAKAASLRDALAASEIDARSKAVEDRLFSFGPFEAARTVMIFVSFRSEVRTEGIMRRALASGKRVAVPLVDFARREMFASVINDFEAELAPGPYGILEPKHEFVRPVPAGEIDFVALPGLAFDRRGNRVGYGGGFYDRFVTGLRPETTLAALAFSIQLFDEVPADETDRKIHALITDGGILLFSKY